MRYMDFHLCINIIVYLYNHFPDPHQVPSILKSTYFKVCQSQFVRLVRVEHWTPHHYIF
jgi:hypothetical protein